MFTDCKTQINNVEIQHFLFLFSYLIIVTNRIIHYVTTCKMYILILLSLLQEMIETVLTNLMDDSFYLCIKFGKKIAYDFFMVIFLK